MKRTAPLIFILCACLFLTACPDRKIPPMQSNTKWLSNDGAICVYFTDWYKTFDVAVLIFDDQELVVPVYGDYYNIYVLWQNSFYGETFREKVAQFRYEMISKDKNGKCNKMKMIFESGDFYEIGTEFIVSRVATDISEEDLPPLPSKPPESSEPPTESLPSLPSDDSPFQAMKYIYPDRSGALKTGGKVCSQSSCFKLTEVLM